MSNQNNSKREKQNYNREGSKSNNGKPNRERFEQPRTDRNRDRRY